MVGGANAPAIQAQSVRVAAHQVQTVNTTLNATPAGQGNIASAVISAQALATPAAVPADAGAAARNAPADAAGQLAGSGTAASSASAAVHAPVAAGSDQAPGSSTDTLKEDEKSAELSTEVVMALSGDAEGKKRQAEAEEAEELEALTDEVELENLEPEPELSFAELLASIEPAVLMPNVRDVGTLFGQGKAARAYKDF